MTRSAVGLALLIVLCSNAWAEPQRGGWFDRWMAPYRYDSQKPAATTNTTPAPNTVIPIERAPTLSDRDYLNYANAQSLHLRSATTRAELIRAVQRELLTRGYYSGEPDGLLGTETRAAIAEFQEDVGTDPTGRIDDTLIDQLEQRAIPRPLYRSHRESETYSAVGDAQDQLSRMGYYDGPIDGVLNPATRIAIRDYRSNPYNRREIGRRVISRSTTRLGENTYPANDTPTLSAERLPDPALPAAPVSELAMAPELQQQCGLTAVRNGDDAEALRQSNALIRGVGSSTAAKHCGFFARGLVHLAREDTQHAIDDFTSALRLAPDSAAAYYNRALTYRAAGRPAFARRDYREAVRLNPELSELDR